MRKAFITDSRRTLIIGNAGSGKSWLAKQLAVLTSADHIELDELHWEPGGFNKRRARDDAISGVRIAARKDTWIIEGVFGWLAKEAVSEATLLLWLVIPEDECVANLRDRKIKSGEDDASGTALIDWCRQYRLRTNANSYLGHEAIYQGFGSQKKLIQSRGDMGNLILSFEKAILRSE
ncbi:hypothetical protein GLI01_00850 [Gluconacetobacter liquefaciens]|uniref:Adenylate kinase family enzyme n=1 Tax=Gluconacetobacter liquefaciens TaxID=89584 RepID=A0A7W4JIU4_GLULI|nr:hypothetical protein [Gluconacetobacter liquefaciens]MBB2185603.1 hypothetical protein [Gluconacetobacter liquefaciens]GEB36050.1 hypothetical protein GLI01_00850 [Gluconacetobacter liquefaciens]